MNKEAITSSQFQILIFTFGLGTYLLFNLGGEAKHDAWIAPIIATSLCVISTSIYGRIMSYHPGKNIFEILKKEFGDIVGLILSMIFIIYVFLLGAYIFNDFIDFIKVTTLVRTPKVILIISIGFLSMWILKAGIQVVSSWAQFFINILMVFIAICWILLLPQIKITNIQPLVYNNWHSIIEAAIKIWVFPMNEVIIFLSFFDCMIPDTNIKTTFIKPVIFSGIVAVLFILTNVSILGENIYGISYYSGYEVAKRLQVGGEFQRIEIVVSATFTLIQFLEISYCLLGVSKGIKSVLNLSDYRDILVPIVFFMMNFTYIIFRSSIKALEFATGLWIAYSLFMQVILPSVILVIIWSKHKFKSDSKE